MNASNKEAFMKWCLGYSGCDGGDIGNIENPSTWICGIEWGGGHMPESLPSIINETVTEPPLGYDEWHENLAYIFNWQVIKLLSAINGGHVSEYKSFAKEIKPFVRGSCGYFKINLYPLAFKDTSPARWHSLFSSITGFDSKADYLSWCATYRLNNIRNWAKISKPKLVICLGKTYLSQFKLAFLEEESFMNHEIIENRDLFWGINSNQSLIVVIPFMVNRNGLTRNVAIQKFGERISNLLTSHSSRPAKAGG